LKSFRKYLARRASPHSCPHWYHKCSAHDAKSDRRDSLWSAPQWFRVGQPERRRRSGTQSRGDQHRATIGEGHQPAPKSASYSADSKTPLCTSRRFSPVSHSAQATMQAVWPPATGPAGTDGHCGANRQNNAPVG
jgi:hypothetical protein